MNYNPDVISELVNVFDDFTSAILPDLEATTPEEPTTSSPEVSYPNFRDFGGELPNLEELSSIPVPENSGSIMVQEFTSRFNGAIWYDKIREKDIILAGIGGIGSFVAFLLSRMCPKSIVLYDDDIIEPANLSGQFYSFDNIDSKKVAALRNNCRLFSCYYGTVGVSRKFDENSTPGDIMICGFDNMRARKTFYNSWKAYILSLSEEDRKNCLFIDGRLAAEEFQVFCLTGTDIFNMERYEKEWLFSDEEADATVCSYKQTTYMANMIGSVIVNLFTNFCANSCDPIIPRDLPFFTSYDASLMYFKTEV